MSTLKQLAWVLVVVAFLVGGCRRQDVRTVTIYVPDMNDTNAVAAISNILVTSHGVYTNQGPLQFDIENHTVTVTYDSMRTARMNLEYAIAWGGYATSNVVANPLAPADGPQ